MVEKIEKVKSKGISLYFPALLNVPKMIESDCNYINLGLSLAARCCVVR